MVLKLWCFVFFTILCSRSCCSLKVNHEIKFVIPYHWKYYKCTGVATGLKVGQQFRVNLNSYYEINDVGSCTKSQASKDNVLTTFKKKKNPDGGFSLVSDHYVTASEAGEWNYDCKFYTKMCKFYENRCLYGSGVWIEDKGINCTTKITVKNSVFVLHW